MYWSSAGAYSSLSALVRCNAQTGRRKSEPVQTRSEVYRAILFGKGQAADAYIETSEYVGSVRAMVVAGQDGAYGNAEKTAFVRTPLMLLSTLPLRT